MISSKIDHLIIIVFPSIKYKRHQFSFMVHIINIVMLQQIVLHPTVDQSLKYASTMVGRDKVYKSIQNLARFLAWYLKRQGYDKETVQRFGNLKSSIALSRKRMFKSF